MTMTGEVKEKYDEILTQIDEQIEIINSMTQPQKAKDKHIKKMTKNYIHDFLSDVFLDKLLENGFFDTYDIPVKVDKKFEEKHQYRRMWWQNDLDSNV